jgi:hypothetical protein
MPTVILRPGIIESALKEPVRWVGGQQLQGYAWNLGPRA